MTQVEVPQKKVASLHDQQQDIEKQPEVDAEDEIMENELRKLAIKEAEK